MDQEALQFYKMVQDSKKNNPEAAELAELAEKNAELTKFAFAQRDDLTRQLDFANERCTILSANFHEALTLFHGAVTLLDDNEISHNFTSLDLNDDVDKMEFD